MAENLPHEICRRVFTPVNRAGEVKRDFICTLMSLALNGNSYQVTNQYFFQKADSILKLPFAPLTGIEVKVLDFNVCVCVWL